MPLPPGRGDRVLLDRIRFDRNIVLPPRPTIVTPEIDSAIAMCGKMPPIVSIPSASALPPRSIVAQGVAYHVTEERRQLVNDVTEHSFLTDMAGAGIWPGAVIQGASLLVGDLAPIGPLDRAPGTVEIVTDLITATPMRQSRPVADPDSAEVNDVRRDILRQINATSSTGILKTDYQSAQTYREVSVKLGLDVKGAAWGVDVNASLNSEYKSSTVVAVIRQIFNTVTFTPDAAGGRGIWREPVSPQDLQPFIGSGNPPLLVQSVHYGRLIVVSTSGQHSSLTLTAALKAHWNAAVSGSATADAKYKEVLDSTQAKIYTIGVPGSNNFSDLAKPSEDLIRVFKGGLNYSPDNPGAPIAFVARHITDMTLAHIGLVASYTAPLGAVGEGVQGARFEVWDGPGGGTVHTGIRCNPGDKLTIRASGQIWSGVFATGTHGPEGWPGWAPNGGAPLPDASRANANSLIFKVGNASWIQAGSHYEGVLAPAPPGQGGGGGTLLLGINDNNPYNGDPGQKWTVYVDVERGDAAAAGIYL